MVTVSCLPQFAQPYLLVRNQTIEGFFGGEKDLSVVPMLLARRKPDHVTWPNFFDRAPLRCTRPQPAVTIYWQVQPSLLQSQLH